MDGECRDGERREPKPDNPFLRRPARVTLGRMDLGRRHLLGLVGAAGVGAASSAVLRSAASPGVAAARTGARAAVDLPAPADELPSQWDLMHHLDGERLMPRTIRYIEDRRAEESRYTGAIETHPSPLGVVWGVDDPVARVAMVDRLSERRPEARVTRLDHVGHYPMVEAPEAFATAVLDTLDAIEG